MNKCEQKDRQNQMSRAKLFASIFAMLICVLFVSGCSSNNSESGALESLTSSTSTTTEELSNSVNVNQLPDTSFLYDASISELLSEGTLHDNQTVQITGEVVGDRISSEDEYDNYWICLQEQDSDNPSCVSVLMNAAQTELIDSYGNYSQVGTTLQVRGTFNMACKYHQGQTDIHAQEVTALKKGTEIDNQVNPVILTAGIISLIAGALLLGFYNYRKEREL
ncbi:MAG: hypothetical protein ACI4BI_02510 [Anaerotardibacter sp.]